MDEGLTEFVNEIVDNGLDGIQEDNAPPPPKKKICLYGSNNGKLQLLPDGFIIPFLTLSSLVTAWYCGNVSKGIPPYRLLRAWDLRHIKSGKSMLSQMRKVMKCMEKGVEIVNLPGLIKGKMEERDAITLYNSVKHLFFSPSKDKKKRRYESMSWKTFYNILSQRKFRLFGEQEGRTQTNLCRDVTQPVRNPVSRQRKRQVRKKSRSIERNIDMDFENAFACKQVEEENTCSLGRRCKNKVLKQFMKCHAEGCTRRIHHLCAISKNLLDEENELNVFCSSHCMLA